jgi:hypothetical protein
MAISYPPIFINEYLKDKLPMSNRNPLPFFPTMPTDIHSLTEYFPDGMFAVFDRMFKMRRMPFPHIKCEQLLYYFYKVDGDPELLIEHVQRVQDLLDRGDESAQELNTWIHSQLTTTEDGKKVYIKNEKQFLPIYFHDIKIYQLEETRDIVDFGTARTFAGNKLIIDFDYHTMGEGIKTVDGEEKRIYNDTIIS